MFWITRCIGCTEWSDVGPVQVICSPPDIPKNQLGGKVLPNKNIIQLQMTALIFTNRSFSKCLNTWKFFCSQQSRPQPSRRPKGQRSHNLFWGLHVVETKSRTWKREKKTRTEDQMSHNLWLFMFSDWADSFILSNYKKELSWAINLGLRTNWAIRNLSNHLQCDS